MPPFVPTRRYFLKGLAATGIASLLPAQCRAASADVLSGTAFTLTIAQTMVNFTGTARPATTVNGSIPAPTLHWREGDTVTLTVVNELTETTSIHWHGLILPYDMDGAPGISFNGIPPGSRFTYRFKVQQSGTYWYHSHSGMQEQTGLYGAIVISPATETIVADRDYVVQLSEWTDEDPLAVFAKLKKQSDYYNFNQPTAVDFIHDVAHDGLGAALDKRAMWNEMRMSMTDLADISGYTYTYLINGKTAADHWLGLFRPGERVRLRFINSAAQTFFDVRIPGLSLTVVHADGQPIVPVSVDELRIGPAETYDVLVSPSQQAYTVFAQSMDRSGFACGTLAVRAGLSAPVPTPDKPEPLTMTDMMGAMSGQVAVHHAKSEYGASVDMRVDTPRTNLDDPGVGLRNNGRRVLTYADLRSVEGIISDQRPPGRDIELHLTGNMERYSWSLDGVAFDESTPIHFRYGERLRVIFVNDTMMSHPMHLHGLWSDLENADGQVQVRKHVVVVQPAQRVSFRVTADARGYWPWHCHLFYHMHGGMFRVVVVA
ncbi:copper resistance system multicopper oxidase [Methylovulum psychrotolerans]|uniref:copper resistance system multicopper oxidase n=1 Tax=Methylovulum psychrotolerans TaxID=1704499 RepID=UPI001BFFB992|nr:copper resistance system multicopper oxidase [Methylovulum psychrotolerans]MBT9098870.1 copper resistance system multicopper oxidase [Methylovulum psychrotolerans]